MPANFPTSVPALATNKADATTTATDHKDHHNQLGFEINAIGRHLHGRVVNVKDYGALGDGSTNDTTAIQNAAASLPTTGNCRGGSVVFPAGEYVINGQLDLNSKNSIKLVGAGSNSIFSATVLKFTATGTTPLIRCHAAQGIRIEGMKISVAAAFTGDLIQCGTVSTVQTTNLEVAHCWIGGDSTTNDQSACLLSLNGVVGAHIWDCSFMYAVYGIKGRISDWSNTVTIDGNCMFNNLTSGAIHQPGESWRIDGNSFEPLQNTTAAAITSAHDTSFPARGTTIANNWFGDTVTNTGIWIDIHGFGIDIHGNLMNGQSAQTAVNLWRVEGGAVSNNDFEAFGTGINVDGGFALGIAIEANRFQSVTTKLGNPAQLNPSSIAGNVTGESNTVASAATLPIPFAHNTFFVSGTTQIDWVSGSNWGGRQVTLNFTGTLRMVSGNNLTLKEDFFAVPNSTITLLADPGSGNWQEVSRSPEGRGLKAPVRAATTTNVTVSAPGAAIDGVTMVAGDRMLLSNQTTPSQNGVYVWNGAAVAATRSTDADTALKLTDSLLVTVDEGTINKDSIWTLSTNKPITLGTTSLRFTRIHPAAVAVSQPAGIYFAPAGAKLENMPRAQGGFANTAMLTTQIIRVFPMGALRAGDTLAALNFRVATTASASITNSWAGIARLSDRVVLAVSATSTATTAAQGLKTFTFTSAYTADKDELLVGFVMYQATTVPTFHGITHGDVSIIADVPVMNGASNTGQTTPIAVAATMTAFTAAATIPYCYAT